MNQASSSIFPLVVEVKKVRWGKVLYLILQIAELVLPLKRHDQREQEAVVPRLQNSQIDHQRALIGAYLVHFLVHQL